MVFIERGSLYATAKGAEGKGSDGGSVVGLEG